MIRQLPCGLFVPLWFAAVLARANEPAAQLPPSTLPLAPAAAAVSAASLELPSGVVDTQPPGAGPPSGEEVLKQMQLPPGFNAKVFAAEPAVRQPIGFDLDDRGRIWVAESYTYPDWKQAGETGIDRLVILEDTDGDGVQDRRTVFAEGLKNLSSVACAGNGVWLLCPPQLVFVPDANRDDVPDGPAQVHLDGFEHDKIGHNIVSNLAWGPDGWLYGLHGIQARSQPKLIAAEAPSATAAAERVWADTRSLERAPESQQRIPNTPASHASMSSVQDENASPDGFPMECTVWRYHPAARRMEPVCFGTTNPWGLDFNLAGEAFFTNCVIGHLWHAIPGAHFKRMYGADIHGHEDLLDACADHMHWEGGTWMDSRINTPVTDAAGGGHSHAGCMIYEGDNWPAEFRGKLFTFNLHGRRINCDTLERKGSGYVSRHAGDYFRVNSEWCRGITLKYGPDGAVYMSDWVDAGECHDDDGVHRASGRIYRIAYGQPAPQRLNLEQESSVALLERLKSPNAWIARHAQRVLFERQYFGASTPGQAVDAGFAEQVFAAAQRSTQLGEWQLLVRLLLQLPQGREYVARLYTAEHEGRADPHAATAKTDFTFHQRLGCEVSDLVGPLLEVFASDSARYPGLLQDFYAGENSPLVADPRVRLAALSAMIRQPTPLSHYVFQHWREAECDASDPTLRAMFNYIIRHVGAPRWLQAAGQPGGDQQAQENAAAARLLNTPARSVRLAMLRELVRHSIATDKTILSAHFCILRELQGHPERKADLLAYADTLASTCQKEFGSFRVGITGTGNAAGKVDLDYEDADPAVARGLLRLGVALASEDAFNRLRHRVMSEPAALAPSQAASVQSTPEERVEDYELLLSYPYSSEREKIIEQGLTHSILRPAALRKLASAAPSLTEHELSQFAELPTEEREILITVSTPRAETAMALLDYMERGVIPPSTVSVYAARQVLAIDNPQLQERWRRVWGEVRDTREEAKQLLAKYKDELAAPATEAVSMPRGQELFKKHCQNCHKLFGEGGDFGPELTGSDRKNLDYVLLNILDPSASVSSSYKLKKIVFLDGRVITGVVLRENENVLDVKSPEGTTSYSKREVEEVTATDQSPMPEGILANLSLSELRDLLAYLATDRASP